MSMRDDPNNNMNNLNENNDDLNNSNDDIVNNDDLNENLEDLFDTEEVESQIRKILELPEIVPGHMSLDTFFENLDIFISGTAAVMINPAALAIAETVIRNMKEISESFKDPVFMLEKPDPTTLVIEYDLAYIKSLGGDSKLEKIISLVDSIFISTSSLTIDRMMMTRVIVTIEDFIKIEHMPV